MRGGRILLAVLLLVLLGGFPFPAGEAAPAPAPWGDWCSGWEWDDPIAGIRIQHCLDYDPTPPGGWVRIVWYLQDSGCYGSQCSSTWVPNQRSALYEQGGHRTWLEQNQAPAESSCGGRYPTFPDGTDPELYRRPSDGCCADCTLWNGRDQCISESGEVFAPVGTWHQSRALYSDWTYAGYEEWACGSYTCRRFRWIEEWPTADPQTGHWSFAEDDNCRSLPGGPTPTPGDPGNPTPPPCDPGSCYPQCSFADLRVNGESAEESPPGPPLEEGPLALAFRTPKPAGCPDGWNYLEFSVYPVGGGPSVIHLAAREAADGPPDMPAGCYDQSGSPSPTAIYVEWSDGTRACMGWDEWAANTFAYLSPGLYYIDGVVQRQQCGVGFSTNCTWHFDLGGVPTGTASLEARLEYWSEHDNDPYHGPEAPYATSSPRMNWNYGEVLHAHPTAGWEEPVFPGWTAETRILRWRYLGSTTGAGEHPAECDPPAASSCDWQEENPRTYMHLRWYRVLLPGEQEGTASGSSLRWVYVTPPATVTLTYEVEAETVWTHDATGQIVAWPFDESLTVEVRLRYLTTYRGR